MRIYQKELWFLNATNISQKLIVFIFWFTLGLASASFRRTFDTEDDPDIEAEEATNLLDKSSTMSHQQPNLMTFEDFQRLPSDKQSEEIFKLLSMLSPFASEVSSLRSSMESALNRYLLLFQILLGENWLILNFWKNSLKLEIV